MNISDGICDLTAERRHFGMAETLTKAVRQKGMVIKMRKFLTWLVLLSVLCTAWTSCRTGGKEISENEAVSLRESFLHKANEVEVTADAVTFTDGLGERVTVPLRPQNVAILYASFTTLWYEAGGTVSGCLGGESATELYREQIGRDITEDTGVRVLADSAQAKRWDIEGILAAAPDLIICSTAMSGYATIAAPAQAAGIPVIVVDYQDFSDYLKWFKVFCHLNGQPALWESIAMAALDEVAALLTSCPTEQGPTVLSMFAGVDLLKANTSATVLGGMLSAMGARNIIGTAADTGMEHTVVDLEAVFAADPDIILIQCHTGEDSARALVERLYGANPVWQSLIAVKEGRVYYLEKDLFHNKPNRRFAEAYTTLAGYLYPVS